jgi:hypothetical protein
MLKLSLATLVLAAGTVTALADIPNPARARTVASDGQNAPGLAGLQIDLYNAAAPTEYSDPCISRSGTVGFLTNLTGTGVVSTNNEAAYLGLTNGTLSLVAREGTQGAGLPAGVNYGAFSYIFLNDPTHVLLGGALAGAGVTAANNAAVYFGDPASWSPLAIKGNPAAGLAPLLYNVFDHAQCTLSTDNTLCLSASVSGFGVTTSNDKALWISANGATPALAAREGDGAPGLAGVTFSNFLDPTSSLTSASALNGGNIFFFASLTGAGVTAANSASLWAGSPGAVSLVIRQGDPAPTLPNPIILSTLGSQSVNGAGVCSFISGLSGTGVTSANNSAIYKGTTGSFTIAARKGAAAPGLPGITMTTFNTTNRPLINSAGQILFQTTIAGTGVVAATDTILAIVNADGSTELVAREGTQYADLPAGVFLSTFSNLTLNDDGNIVFSAVLIGTGVVAANNESMWSWSHAHGLRLLAREGESMLVGPGETRTPTTADGFDYYGGTGNDDGARGSLANNGDLTIRSVFTDGSTRLLVLDSTLFACGLADLGSTGGTAGYDGVLDNNDFIVFIDYFFAQNPLADQGSTGGVPGADGVFDNNDFVVFIDHFFAGCAVP